MDWCTCSVPCLLEKNGLVAIGPWCLIEPIFLSALGFPWSFWEIKEGDKGDFGFELKLRVRGGVWKRDMCRRVSFSARVGKMIVWRDVKVTWNSKKVFIELLKDNFRF